MENLYHTIIKKIFKEEDIKSALEEIEKFLGSKNIEFKYLMRVNENQKKFTNFEGLIDETKGKFTLVNSEKERYELNGYVYLIYKLEEAEVYVRINQEKHDNLIDTEELLELLVRMVEKILEIEKYRIHSYINPFFFEVSKIFYNNRDIDEALEEFYYLVYGILGVSVIKIEKMRRVYYVEEGATEEATEEFRYKNLKVLYKIERAMDTSIEIDKILKIIFYILNNFLEMNMLEEKQNEFLEYQIASKENLTKLNKLLEKSLYKMTFISNLYKKLSKVREVDLAIDIVEKFVKGEVGYNYLKIVCGDVTADFGEFSPTLQRDIFEDYLIEGKIEYRLEFYKKEITNEDQVYMGLIFNNSKVEIENMLLYKRVEELATLDGITGLYIHRYFIEQLDKELEIARRYLNRLSLIMMDIDNFKKFNDTYGHLEGDHILAEVSRIIRESIRNVDIACRYGGEEFIIIVPFTDEEHAQNIAERIRENIEIKSKVTVSIGVTEYIYGEARDAFIKRVDTAMYEAKKTGKNKVVKL